MQIYLSPTVGIITLFVGFIISAAIRAPFETKSKKVTAVKYQRDGLEVFLLAMMTVGLIVVPLVYAFTDVFSFADHPLPAAAYWIGVVFLLAYLWLFYRSHADLGTNWSVTLEIKDKHALITHGVYSRIRHPMYTSIYFYAIAQLLLLPNWVAGSASLVAFTLLYVCRIGREERMMAETFGDTYTEYSRKTKRLIPYLF